MDFEINSCHFIYSLRIETLVLDFGVCQRGHYMFVILIVVYEFETYSRLQISKKVLKSGNNVTFVELRCKN